jgi:endoglucanase
MKNGLLLLCLVTWIVTSFEMKSSQRVGASPNFPLYTNGSYIIDSSQKRVKFACVNWYGAHMGRYVVDGLDKQDLEVITDRIRNLGFNCVRLVYSLDLIYLNPVVDRMALAMNPNFFGLKAMDIFKKVVSSISSKGLMTILNNHISKAGWCCSETDG